MSHNLNELINAQHEIAKAIKTTVANANKGKTAQYFEEKKDLFEGYLISLKNNHAKIEHIDSKRNHGYFKTNLLEHNIVTIKKYLQVFVAKIKEIKEAQEPKPSTSSEPEQTPSTPSEPEPSQAPVPTERNPQIQVLHNKNIELAAQIEKLTKSFNNLKDLSKTTQNDKFESLQAQNDLILSELENVKSENAALRIESTMREAELNEIANSYDQTSQNDKFKILQEQNDRIISELEIVKSENTALRADSLLREVELKTEIANSCGRNPKPSFSDTLTINEISKLMPKFNGKPEDLRSFVKKIDDLNIYVKTDNEQARFATLIKLSLTSEAADLLVDEDNLNTWTEIKAMLIKTCSPHINHSNYIALLQKMEQGESESVEAFTLRVKAILKKLKCVIPEGATKQFWFPHCDKYAIQCLEDGIRDIQVQTRLVAAKLDKYHIAAQHAIDIADRLKKGSTSKEMKPNPKFTPYKKPDQTYNCTICNKTTHSTDICYKNPKNMNKETKQEADKKINSIAQSIEPNERAPELKDVWFEQETDKETTDTNNA